MIDDSLRLSPTFVGPRKVDLAGVKRRDVKEGRRRRVSLFEDFEGASSPPFFFPDNVLFKESASNFIRWETKQYEKWENEKGLAAAEILRSDLDLNGCSLFDLRPRAWEHALSPFQ